ncbi:DUF3017 domain-containing protein [Sanguibacter hominis ATCC BAA-789]|uniref:DUF3017 domain-containing protein n=1 Tax=Sanguibacter hominis ATCC BAA-789 TaxID=1312740 RepID=A0A9X5ING6_9MICO|nr:DUF3017 domain-containing protein [Sanguibacter hominis ATCC BAA-789]
MEQTSAGDDPEVDAGRVPVDDVAAASRAIAPRRNLWIWANIAMIVVVCVLAFVVGSRIAALVLAAQLAVCGGVRLVASEPVAGLAIRSRIFDVGLFWTLCAAITVIAVTAPQI